MAGVRAPVPAGAMRHRVTISSVSLAADGDGGTTPTASTVGTVFAAIEAISQNEIAGHDTVSSLSSHRITIRYLAGVTTACKVTFGSRTFGIDGIENVGEQNGWLVLSCTEKAA